MSTSPLTTYLNDHLAGAASAIALLEEGRSRHADDALGPFFDRLLGAVERDRGTLRDVFARAGGTESSVKEAAGWLFGKASQIKIRYATASQLAVLEILDGLALGIEGKRALWTALDAACASDPRFEGIDFPALLRRAERQHAEVEAKRVEVARHTFGDDASTC